MSTPQTVTVPVALDLTAVREALVALRVLCSQIGFALDTAILALAEETPR